ncbi:MAG: caspase family protein, partial [Rhizobacter sp.]
MSELDNPTTAGCNLTRRALAALPLALAGIAAAPFAAAELPASGGSTRLALLIGNAVYPAPHDLPPVHKNIRDLSAALQQRDFKVTAVIDLDPAALRRAIQAFAAEAQKAPPDATVLFYFTGHGMQVDAENLMLGAGIAPNAREDVLLNSSLHLQRDVVDMLPRRSTGMSIAVVDACRVDLRAALAASDGFNQVEAPSGCLIVFSTGAGKPAIAPARETDNTFYTASLVKLLQTGADELSFSDLFRLVKLDVQQTM